jgi:hypothetical protein
MNALTQMSPRQRSHATYMLDVMQRLEWDFHNTIFQGRRIPPAWVEISRATPHQTKVKVTQYFEADVIKFFKSMGTGYGQKMNDVLKAYMHGKIAGVIEGPDTIQQYRGGAEKPEWGDTSRKMGRTPEDEPLEMTPTEMMDRAMDLLAANKARLQKAGKLPRGKGAD